MRQPIDVLASYLQLARAAKRREQPLVRDRVLLLAAVIAAQIDLEPVAAACRELILANNPRHLISRWRTVGVALETEDFQSLVGQLSTRYGPERVEQLVQQLDATKFDKRADYASDGEYAAALLDMDWDELKGRFGSESEE